jgi:hypothetical protein
MSRLLDRMFSKIDSKFRRADGSISQKQKEMWKSSIEEAL